MDKTTIMVEFAVMGDEFPPDEVTKALSIKPTSSWLKGEKIADKNITRKETSWAISTGYEESLDMNEQLQKIIVLFENKKADLRRVSKLYELDCKFFVVIKIVENYCPGIYIDCALVDFLREIKAEIDMDLYVT
ncbi:DUF4279 domain-containing protein [Marininema halotolerans]|uniref:DUF4279 domain-containing protein n=1 Tax=Marininema halotolerans TaxID=1155944 RepID=A0A1I6ULI7_9BACL|nr:DUF4279 domain-containing protein [Marininema halotolerans]SFT02325.1 protein of unknown function [Marininema halotolerans]